ncbi:glycoside hydrolase family protein [Weissella minor]|uniref:glycoside hydrolase family protein n=1 Tax=Weissella minor TaxID=1620 RepID=UPI001BAEB0C3|nr:glycoside hydrolase family protein [Weissella minor]
MKTSENGINFIKSYEGFSARAYQLGDGGWTIGYGSYNVPGVGANTVWTEQQATAQLKKDVVRFENAVNGIGATLNQNQFDALVSFTYNLGPGWITTYPAMPQALRDQNWKYMTDSMMNFVNPGSQFEAGLRRRRAAEVKLFNSGGTPQKPSQPNKSQDSAAIAKFKKAGNGYKVTKAFRVDELKQINGMWQIVNYKLAGGKPVNWTNNGIPVAIVDKTDSSGKKTSNQVLKVGDYAKFMPSYDNGKIDAYDTPTNGVGIVMGKYGMIWYNADEWLKL